ncbi:MAG: Coenzyme F420 hydrogenase/dehydrogenase, beta subunit C-terminal domain [Bacteroidaceae bacterium]|nr:Coenzyme F420 hydrogenase/dehydrogenase, beta subunit C-terminal domain [Bacteroidaceae bacterium]
MECNNISKIHDCYGCGLCSASCGKKVISIELNRDGFYEPRINEPDKCTNCGICLDVCAFNHEERALKDEEIHIKSWAAYSNDEEVRRKCSSGGIGFEIGKQLIEQGYHAVGCRYDIKEQRAEHYIATTVEDFVQSIGSKYIQSYTEKAFKKINRKGQKYLITGTPCQIDSFRRMIRKFRCEDNFILMDFYCHCVPSMLVWKAYIKMLEPNIGKVTYASWRNKFDYGWHDSWLMGMDGENTSKPVDWHDSYNLLIREKKTYIQSRLSQGDLFYKLFLGDVALGPQCEKQCKYKYDKSSADIRIGDLWGETYKDNQKGVSALVAFTAKGREVVEGLQNVTLVEHPFEVVAEGQMKQNAKAKETRTAVMYLLRKGFTLNGVVFKIVLFSQRVITKLKSML